MQEQKTAESGSTNAGAMGKSGLAELQLIAAEGYSLLVEQRVDDQNLSHLNVISR